MQESQIEVGRKYAMRVKVSAGEPLLQVQVVEKTGRRAQVKVRRLSEPHAGLEEFIKTRQLIVPWGERQAFLRDEERAQQFDAARPRPNQALAGAIQTVMYSTGYTDASADDDGTIHMRAEELREISRLAGVPQKLDDLHPLAYVDRDGYMHLPIEVAEKLAHAYASAESEMVLMYIEDEENECRARGYEPGERFYHDWLREKTPGFALARYWAGHEEEVVFLRKEIERLRKVIDSAADALVKAGAEQEGWRVRRAKNGR
jgi:hypothetical protein